MKTAATGQPPIERALKTDVLTIGGIPTAILTDDDDDDDDDMVEWSTVPRLYRYPRKQKKCS